MTGHCLVLVTRTAGPPEKLFSTLQKAMMSVDQLLPLTGQASMRELLAGSVATARFNTLLLAALGAIALALGAE
ncbi:MAG TPA: hypothetical protein VN677_06260 [Gemmatimonadaceae bacterium]|nr:hypothetical protein [Gemmatimonadaceae bacterium]